MQKATRSRSFLTKSISIIALAITALTGYKAAAVDVVTDPVGFIKLNAVAGPNKYSLWGLGMVQIPTNVGLVGSVSGTQVTLSNQTLVAGALDRIVAPPNTNFTHFIEITSGPNAGLIDDVVSNNTTSVFTASNDSGLISAGQTYKIYPHWTLSKVFGPNDESGLQPGTSEANADQVILWDTSAQSFASPYYFKTNTAGGGTGWRRAGTPTVSRANTELFIEQGLLIQRRGVTGTNVLLAGAVKLGKTANPILAGPLKYTLPANVYPASFTLDASGLYTTNSTTGVQPGTSEANADQVIFWDVVAQSFGSPYYFKTNTAGGGTGWRRAGAPTVNAGTTNIVLGSSQLLLRRSGGGFNWIMPQPFVQ